MENNKGEIINRVERSPLITIDLADHYVQGERIFLDIKDQLFQGMILREKDFRDFVENHDWAEYQGKLVAVGCTADAIVPVWAYMLLATKLEPVATKVVFGTLEELEHALFMDQLAKFDLTEYEGKKIVIKGCGDIDVPTSIYVELTRMMTPVVDKIMYGEPCSTVPVYRKGKMK